MAVYAAQVHCMDYNIGKLIESLKKSGKLDNTLIFFMSDNRACAEPHNELGGGKQKDINNPAMSGHPSYGKSLGSDLKYSIQKVQTTCIRRGNIYSVDNYMEKSFERF